MSISRRRFTTLAGSALGALALAPGCGIESFVAQGNGRLSARPKPGTKTTVRGRTQLKIGGTRDGWLDVPSSVSTQAMPLVVMLHGAGGGGERFLARFGTVPDVAGVAALWLDSRGQTWDAIRGGFGPDVAFMDRALEHVFGQVAVDPERVAIGGFSDGATYALSLGIINGDLFRKVIAFSPGFIVEGESHGRPNIFLSHGISDPILPIDRCSRVIAPMLKTRGYGVVLREFEGGHEIPADVATAGFSWVSAK